MLTPIFSCSQDDRFVLVRILLSAICKITDAVFDITATQFTFYCRPYYLRLKFNERLTEDKGERATYDVEANTLVVYLPKETTGQAFTQLDNPAYLLATEKQRGQLLQVLHTDEQEKHVGDEEAAAQGAAANEEEDDEYVQTVPSGLQSDAAPLVQQEASNDEGSEAVHYGFGNFFSGLFAKADPGLIHDMIDLPDPEHTTAAQRTLLRLRRENDEFDEDALLACFADEDGEVARLLHYVPAHVRDFEAALRESGVAWTCRAAMPSPPQAEATSKQDNTNTAGKNNEDALEEETAPLPGRAGAVEVWCGNVGTFGPPVLVHELTTLEDKTASGAMAAAATATAEEEEEGSEDNNESVGHDMHENNEEDEDGDMDGEAVAPATITSVVTVSQAASEAPPLPPPPPPPRLALPRHRPTLHFTADENAALIDVRLPRLLFPPTRAAVVALTLDLLLAEAYDDVVTEGTGCSESLWNLCALSPALSFLDPASNVYDACVYFARRALIYPLHRHFALVQRVFALVGTRLLLGRHYVVRALLRVRAIVAHAEHKHILATLFLDPLIGYWMNKPEVDALLAQAALELHAHVTRTAPECVTLGKTSGAQGSGQAAAAALLMTPSTRTLQPLTLLSLGLPFA